MTTTKEPIKYIRISRKRYYIQKKQKEKLLRRCGKKKKKAYWQQAKSKMKHILGEIAKTLCIFNLINLMQYCMSGNTKINAIIAIIQYGKHIGLEQSLQWVERTRTV